MKPRGWILILILPALPGFTQQPEALSGVKEIDSLLHQSKALSAASRFDEAIQLQESAAQRTLDQFGHSSKEYARCLFLQGKTMHTWGKMDDAEPFLQEALSIQALSLGKENQEYASTLFELASLTKDLGYYAEAETLYLEAIRIQGKVLGKENADYAWSLNYLGNLYRATGEYEKAEQLCLESRDIRERVLGKESTDYAWSLNSLANIYTDKGDFDKAEPLYMASKDIREKKLGKSHPNYAASLNNLGLLYVKKGEYDRAEPLYLEAKEIRARVLGVAHPAYAVTLNNLAELYYLKRDYAKVESLYLEARDIQLKVFGNSHPDYALSLDNLANLYTQMGAFAKAAPLYQEAKEIREKKFGKQHPDYALSLRNLALFFTQQGDYASASRYYLQANQIGCLLINKSAEYSSEIQQNAYLHTFEEPVDRFYSFTQTHPDSALLRAAYNNNLFFNGYLLENSRLLLRSINAADSLTRTAYEKWQDARRRLAKRYARPIEERKKIAEGEAEAETYEKMLLRSLPAFRETRKIPGWRDVQRPLQPDEAAVEFIHFRFFSPDKTDRIQYAAMLLRPGWEAPKFIPLFEEKQLDSLLENEGERKAHYVAKVYATNNRGIILKENPTKTLFELIWEPLEKELKAPGGTRVSTVFCAPTGLLHRINLAAIPINADSILLDRYQLIELGSTRQLATHTHPETYNNEAVLFGGIQFEMDSTALLAANAKLQNIELASRGYSESPLTDSISRGAGWGYLKWTEKEVNTLAPIFSAAGLHPVVRKGFDATEEAFKSIVSQGHSPRIIHLATHGFFFSDPKDNTASHATLSPKESGFVTSDNPLIRSGLLLAGANYAWMTGKPLKKGMENGILTAYEISHLNLSNTELVVLSACETGLGDIQGNEGVYGLQRAFKIAGAQYLLMSLWKVPDIQTQELMTAFYTHWLTEKKKLPEAFQIAQQEMREKYENPYFWAGFVLME